MIIIIINVFILFLKFGPECARQIFYLLCSNYIINMLSTSVETGLNPCSSNRTDQQIFFKH